MTCPSCGSQRVFPSRLRNSFERLRNRLTDRQPYRCHDCGHRKWHLLAFNAPNPDIAPEDLRTGQRPAAVSTDDLDPLDPADRETPEVSDGELDPLDPNPRQ
jgi:hypothetical protein